MAFVRYEGVRKPSALDHLIKEGILSADPLQHEYSWDVYNDKVCGDEEVLATSTCVTWSRGGIIRRFLQFDFDHQKVQQALLTWFDSRPISLDLKPNEDSARSPRRALVVILEHHACIHYLDGPNHLVYLPFQVERALSLPRGVLLLRRLSTDTVVPPTPVPLAAPPNSFFSSQAAANASFAQPSPGGFRLEGLRQSSGIVIDDNAPKVWILDDPLDEVGVVFQERTIEGSAATVSLGPHEEEVLYISSEGEIPFNELKGKPLMIAITLDVRNSTICIWHAQYTPRQDSTHAPSSRHTRKSSRSRRRSSHGLRASTGINTPRLRLGDQHNDSVSQFSQNNISASQQSASNPVAAAESSQKSQSKIEASFELLDDEVAISNRRTSSLIARAELSHGDPRNFSDLGKVQSNQASGYGQRSSFGLADARKSHGSFRKSMRLSSASMGLRLEDVDEQMQLDFDDDVTEYPTSDLDSLTEKMTWFLIKSFPYSTTSDGRSAPETTSVADTIRAFTFYPTLKSKQQNVLSVFIVNKYSQTVSEVQLALDRGSTKGSSRTEIRRCRALDYRRLPYSDGLEVRDDKLNTILFLSHRDSTFQASIHSRPPSNSSTDDLAQGFSFNLDFPSDVDVNKEHIRLSQARQLGRFDVSDGGGVRHAFETRLSPITHEMREALEVIAEVMDDSSSSLWDTYTIYWHAWSKISAATDIEKEQCALVVTVLFYPAAVVAAFKNDLPLAADFFKPRTVQQSKENQSHANESRFLATNSWIGANGLKVKRYGAQLNPSSPGSNRIDECINYSKELALSWARAVDSIIYKGGDDRATNFRRAVLHIQKLLVSLHTLREARKFHITMLSDHDSSLIQALAIAGQWLGCEQWTLRQNQYLASEFNSLVPAVRRVDEQDFGVLDSIPRLTGVESKELHHQMSAINSLHPCSIFDAIQAQFGGYLDAILPFLKDGASASGRDMVALAVNESNLLNRLLQSLQMFHVESVNLQLAKKILASTVRHRFGDNFLPLLTEGLRVLFAKRLSGLIKRRGQGEDNLSQPSDGLILRKDGSWVVGARGFEAQTDSIDNVSKDVHEICASERELSAYTPPSDGALVMHRFLFRTDKRVSEAKRLLDPLRIAVAEILPRAGSTEAMFLEDQKALAQNVYKRTMAIPSGQAALNFASYQPMLTEKLMVPSFNTSCNMQPSNNTVMASQANFTEEKVCWAFFHAGVNAGLRISKHAPGINTSWLVLNKPQDLGNRHAGFLFALGLNGHLKSMARWLAFKYLTPKHNMTSIGLLLGLAASNLGTMDNMITRLLSVHVIRLLPPGTAELNLSPLTQTAGVAGIGLLYYNSEHRRMSEVLLSEIEHLDNSEPSTNVKDEGYRLAAGISLGFINLGKGRSHTTHGLHIAERLLAVATGTKETANVHILDQSTAGATIALAFIFMKTGDAAIAKRIDAPTSTQQFDFIRPDILCLRTLAKNLIMWDDISSSSEWFLQRLPIEYRHTSLNQSLDKVFKGQDPFTSDKIPFYNIATGLCFSIGLKFAGTADTTARDLLGLVLTSVMSISLKPTKSFDQNLTRDSIIRLQYTVALCMAAIMAGTGDLVTFRRLRMLYAAVHEETSFGHHQAATMAIGILFLGGGRYTLSRSTFAIASLVCAFYPIFPKDVLDNRAHLQALRHLWVFAAEARAIMPRDMHTDVPVVTPITVNLNNGETETLTAPCLLPDLDTISTVEIQSKDYHAKTLDFTLPATVAQFKNDQSIYLHRKSLAERYPDPIDRQLALLSKSSSAETDSTTHPFTYDAAIFSSLLDLPAFKHLAIDRGELLDLLSPAWDHRNDDMLYNNSGTGATHDPPVSTLLDLDTTTVDSLLVLGSTARDSEDRARLEDLKTLVMCHDWLKWKGEEEGIAGFSDEWVERLKGILVERVRREQERAAAE